MTRTTGSFGVSIGTDLALETIVKPAGGYFDSNRDIPKYDHKNINIFYLDITTLFRNILTSLEEEPNMKTDGEAFRDMFMEEVDTIFGIMNMIGVNTKLYMPDVDKKLKKYKIRQTTKSLITNIQAFNVAKDAYPIIAKEYPVDKIPNMSNKNITLAHFAPFMLELDGNILVSHTGNIMKRRERGYYYKKFKGFNGKTLPLNETLLKVFGERQNVIEYYSISERRMAYATLVKNKVTPLTSETRCKSLLNKLIRSHDEK